MNFGTLLPLASITAVRPVFLIVMGVSLVLIAWRLSKITSGWTARLIVSGALLLGFGYALLLPMYEAGIIEPVSSRGIYRGAADAAVAWNTVKTVVMNGGWLLFGLGVALHARVFSPAPPRRQPATSPIAHHESIA